MEGKTEHLSLLQYSFGITSITGKYLKCDITPRNGVMASRARPACEIFRLLQPAGALLKTFWWDSTVGIADRFSY